MKFTDSLKALTKLVFQRSALGGGSTAAPFFGQDFSIWNDFWRLSGSTPINYEKEVGDLRSSALLMAAHTWVSKGLTGARLKVVALGADNKETEIQDHPLIQKIDEPNDYYGSDELFSGYAFSWLTRATSYWLIFKDSTDEISEIWYEPTATIRPVWPNDGSAFLTGYQVNRNGEWLDVPLENVLIFRNGIDPETREGISQTSSLICEHYTDQQAAQFAALLMKQGLVPPIVATLGDKDRQVDKLEMQEFKDGLMRVMSGSRAGEPVVTNAPTSVETLAYDYSKLGLRDVRAIPEERFCSAMGISPYSLHFGISHQASTFSNVQEYLKQDYQSYMVPLHKYIAKRIQKELLPAFDKDARLRVKWDYSEVPLMQQDLTVEWARVSVAYKSRILDQAEAREAIGYASDDRHKDVYYPVPAATTSEDQPEDAPQPTQPAFPVQPVKRLQVVNAHPVDPKQLEDGRAWWRLNAPPEAQDLIDAQVS